MGNTHNSNFEKSEIKFPKSVEEWEYSFSLISEFFEWIASYEQWAKWFMGSSYRKAGLKDWDQSRVSGDEISWAWNIHFA